MFPLTFLSLSELKHLPSPPAGTVGIDRGLPVQAFSTPKVIGRGYATFLTLQVSLNVMPAKSLIFERDGRDIFHAVAQGDPGPHRRPRRAFRREYGPPISHPLSQYCCMFSMVPSSQRDNQAAAPITRIPYEVKLKISLARLTIKVWWQNDRLGTPDRLFTCLP